MSDDLKKASKRIKNQITGSQSFFRSYESPASRQLGSFLFKSTLGTRGNVTRGDHIEPIDFAFFLCDGRWGAERHSLQMCGFARYAKGE